MRPSFVQMFFVFATAAIFFSCTKESTNDTDILQPPDFDTLVFEHSVKGWELYSWPNGADWNYSIVPGTNTLKNYELVTENDIRVSGINHLKVVLDHMPEGEEIFWMSENWLNQIWNSPSNNLMLPPADVVTVLDDYCVEKGLRLTIAW